MWTCVIMSLIVLLTLRSSHGSFPDSFNDVFDRSMHQFATRGTLSNTGYLNYLLSPVVGLPGRVLHFLVTDTDGFGKEVKKLDYIFKRKYGENEYVELEREVVETFPFGNALVRSMKLMDRVREVRDPVTERTLGDAIDILKGISGDRTAVNEFIERWHMIKEADTVFANPSTSDGIDAEQLKQMRYTLLNNPDEFGRLFTDPEVLSRISSAVLESLQGIDLTNAVESVQNVIDMLRNRHPEVFRELINELSDVKASQSDMSFAECLRTLANIVKTPEFGAEFKELISTDNLRKIHETVQDVFPKLLGSGAAEKAAKPLQLQAKLASIGYKIPLKNVEALLQNIANGSIFGRIDEFFANAAALPGGLTAKNVVTQLRTLNINDVNADSILFVTQILPQFQPEDVARLLADETGIVVPPESLANLISRSNEINRLS